MNAPIVSVRELTKAYRLYERPADRLKEVLMPWRTWHKPFLALENITFDLNAGEHLGILGVNGAGKSTLLQVLSGVLTPTSGTVDVRGRLACLLELGAGFNPELTGRENVIFQLQLSNFPADKVEEKVNEVKGFSEVGDFFDQPMKTYSSGMFVRVAFAAAILTEPDILIIDEALSVGDARFQKKCFDHLSKLRLQGTTVILVTHDIFGAKANCSRLLLLDQGRLVADGRPEDVVTDYMHILYPASDANKNLTPTGKQATASKGQDALRTDPISVSASADGDNTLKVGPTNATNHWGRGGATLLEVRFFGLLPPNRFINCQTIVIECDYTFDPASLCALASEEGVSPLLSIGMRVDAGNGMPLCDFSSSAMSSEPFDFDLSVDNKATFRFEATLPRLAPGEYFFTPAVSIGDKDSYIPIAVYENTAILHCERSELILGLFKPDYTVQRIA